MAIQSSFGKLSFNEDFLGLRTATISDATAANYGDVLLVPVSGDVALTPTVDESGGVAAFSGAAGANDGIAIVSAPMQPSGDGPIWCEGRFKVSITTDYQAFLGFQETVSLTETVNPFTLSGTTLTSNNGGQSVGFYYDTGATTDDFRLHMSSDGTELTTAKVKNGFDASTTLGALGVRAGVTLTADEWMIFRVEIDPDGTCRGYFGRASMATSGVGRGSAEGLTLVGTIEAGNIDETALLHPIIQLF